MKKLYIAYGSNLNLEQMKHRCLTAKVVGKGMLTGYQLLFRGYDGGAVATIEKKAKVKVPVLVWELKESDEKALDIYEGWPRLYRKEYIETKLNGKCVTAMVYIMNDGRPLGRPGLGYYWTIYDSYKSAGFDTEILDKAVNVSMKDTKYFYKE